MAMERSGRHCCWYEAEVLRTAVGAEHVMRLLIVAVVVRGCRRSMSHRNAVKSKTNAKIRESATRGFAAIGRGGHGRDTKRNKKGRGIGHEG